jgi:signal transduction histidine kinase
VYKVRLRAFSVPPLLFDAALALLLGVVGAAQLVSQRRPFEERAPRLPVGGERFPEPNGGAAGGLQPPPVADTLAYVLLGLSAASLVLRSRQPLLSLAGVTLFGAVYLERGQPVFAVQLIVLVAVYSAVADSALPRGVSILVSLVSGAILGGALYLSNQPLTDAQWAMDAAWLIAAIFLGDSVRSRRAIAAQLETSREEESKRRVSEERLQIARELHDVVGHNISLISVQAGAGSHVLYKYPEQAKETFDNIRNASHETLQELRSLVGVLRETDRDGELAPTVGMDALDQLVKSFTDAGQDVRLTVVGDRRHLAGIVDLAAYRILQEALTNTVRHAPKARVEVRVNYGADTVAIDVTNDRGDETAPRETGGGHGLVGMRERALAIGGRLDAGPQAGGGYHVEAVLPLTGGAAS